MKLIVNLKNKELSKYLEFTNSFLIGLKDYCVNYYEASISDIKSLLKEYPNIELFISINKNIFNDDLGDLEEKLKELSKLSVKGILFYDLSVLSIVKRNLLPLNLCIHQTHMVTNYNICNFYKNLGCEYGYLSTEITSSEILEIASHTSLKLMGYFIGHPIISHSKRKLVSNYYESTGSKEFSKTNIIKEKNKETKYYIVEDKLGTNILTYNTLNGTKAFIELKDKLEYAILDSNFLEEEIFLEILKNYYLYLHNELTKEKLITTIGNLIGNYDGFFYTKTIYKVKE